MTGGCVKLNIEVLIMMHQGASPKLALILFTHLNVDFVCVFIISIKL